MPFNCCIDALMLQISVAMRWITSQKKSTQDLAFTTNLRWNAQRSGLEMDADESTFDDLTEYRSASNGLVAGMLSAIYEAINGLVPNRL